MPDTKLEPLPPEGGDLLARLKSSAKAFRENTVYTDDGDPIRLGVQADEMDEAACEIERLTRERDEEVRLRSFLGERFAAASKLYVAAEAERDAAVKALGAIRDLDLTRVDMWARARAALDGASHEPR